MPYPDSRSPQEKRGSAQDYEQFKKGSVPDSWYPDPTEQDDGSDEDATKPSA